MQNFSVEKKEQEAPSLEECITLNIDEGKTNNRNFLKTTKIEWNFQIKKEKFNIAKWKRNSK